MRSKKLLVVPEQFIPKAAQFFKQINQDVIEQFVLGTQVHHPNLPTQKFGACTMIFPQGQWDWTLDRIDELKASNKYFVSLMNTYNIPNDIIYNISNGQGFIEMLGLHGFVVDGLRPEVEQVFGPQPEITEAICQTFIIPKE